MKSLLITGLILLSGFLSMSAELTNAQTTRGIVSSGPSAKLGNGDVVDLVKAGLPEEVIIAKVQGSPCDFDTSPTALATLKSAQVPNAIILTMVKKSSQMSTADRDASARPGNLSPASEPSKTNAQPFKGCLAVRPIGSHALRNVILFGAAGALISHMQYQVVDAVDYPAKIGQKYHGNDLQTIQGNGTNVVLLDKHYSVDELHMACHQ